MKIEKNKTYKIQLLLLHHHHRHRLPFFSVLLDCNKIQSKTVVFNFYYMTMTSSDGDDSECYYSLFTGNFFMQLPLLMTACNPTKMKAEEVDASMK